MKCIMVMFDSLNRHMLPPYGCDWTHAPNFKRLAQRTVTFDRSYICSMPCMPARRDLHTGRPNFLHRSWGPLEAFDDSMPQMLQNKGIYTHLVSDHYHYWEDGGATYHGRYNSWQFFRGQEADAWVGQVAPPYVPKHINGKDNPIFWVNRQFMRNEEDQPQSQTFRAGVDFIDRNHDQDNWFVQIECFDPHEPFQVNRKYTDLYPHDYSKPIFDCPAYGTVKNTPEEVQQAKHTYASLLSMCDASLGHVLDAMDKYDMWKDTMLIVWTDHGFMLGEHNYFAKNMPVVWQEISHTPFFVWDPRSGKRGERRQSLVQPSIDLGPTLLDYFGVEKTKDMLGQNLRDTIATDKPVREAGIFGYHANRIAVTDGRYVYYRAPVYEDHQPAYNYTLNTMKMRGFINGLDRMECSGPLSFTKGMKVMKIPVPANKPHTLKSNPEHLLFDLQTDPKEANLLTDPALEKRLISQMVTLMKQADAPPDQYERMGLSI